MAQFGCLVKISNNRKVIFFFSLSFFRSFSLPLLLSSFLLFNRTQFRFILKRAFHHIFIRIHTLYTCTLPQKLFQFHSNWLTSMLTKMTHGFSFMSLFRSILFSLSLSSSESLLLSLSIFGWATVQLFNILRFNISSSSFFVFCFHFFLFRSLPKETFFFPLTFRCCLQPYKLLDVRMLVCIYALILYIQPISNYNSIGGNDQHTEPTTTTTTITVHLILFDRIRIRIVSWKCMTKIVGAGDFDIRERSRIKIRYAVWK